MHFEIFKSSHVPGVGRAGRPSGSLPRCPAPEAAGEGSAAHFDQRCGTCPLHAGRESCGVWVPTIFDSRCLEQWGLLVTKLTSCNDLRLLLNLKTIKAVLPPSSHLKEAALSCWNAVASSLLWCMAGMASERTRKLGCRRATFAGS